MCGTSLLDPSHPCNLCVLSGLPQEEAAVCCDCMHVCVCVCARVGCVGISARCQPAFCLVVLIDVLRVVEGNQWSLPARFSTTVSMVLHTMQLMQPLRHKDPTATRAFDRVALCPPRCDMNMAVTCRSRSCRRAPNSLECFCAASRQDCRVTFDYLPGQIERNKTGLPGCTSRAVSSLLHLARPAETGGPHSKLQIGLGGGTGERFLPNPVLSISVLVRAGPQAVVIKIGLADQKAEPSP